MVDQISLGVKIVGAEHVDGESTMPGGKRIFADDGLQIIAVKDFVGEAVGKRFLADAGQFGVFAITEQEAIASRRTLGIDVIRLHTLFVEDGKIIAERKPSLVHYILHQLRNALIAEKLLTVGGPALFR